MKSALIFASVGAGILLCSCAEQVTRINYVREVPLKSTVTPGMDTGFHRAQSSYLLHGAYSQEMRKERLGQYYYVTWYDADPTRPLTLTMQYRQGKTGSKTLSKTITLSPGRDGGEQTAMFTFIGAEARDKGPVMAWKTQLKDKNGKVLSEQRSFLWSDKN